MRGMHSRVFLCVLGLLILAFVSSTDAQTKHPWGFGSFAGYTLPVWGTGERFSGTQQVGGTLQYQYSSRMMMEIEYQHVFFKDGKEAKQPFIWPLDSKQYYSPLAVSQIRFNTGLFNLLVSLKGGGFEKKSLVYLTVGTGVYSYKAERRNFIFPGQTTLPLNTSLYILPQVDERATLGINAGMGGQVFVGKSVALDLRARYHIVMGELRPMSAWGFDNQTLPLQFIELGAGLKFYIHKS
ncbi:MAG: hypothetical protein A3F84_26160 [Candidatus Handelsmanbacteria bacterium RIFCSPLOWO2_12_FULL_64_10]|uniref:Uncharacterized protein n=1 Tax=Handelsmanbacteria sp. (strain RIFCSPLOWO2_12_FULL_64_10) TaxID=1817868 RepID=A0A1F6CAH0_HANXR|nr:MAG: hypothetical protein A3F84_26160 [Candidatus Handelsmanbacteria bacterium RIFCSPLOWO2_12_FULL_64_10]